MLYEALVIKALDNFTILELSDACSLTSPCVEKVNLPPSYKLLYRQLDRLVRRGILSKSRFEGGSVQYKKSKLFDSTNFVINKILITKKPEENVELTNINVDIKRVHIEERLLALVGRCKVDLLTCIGESEEYIRIYSEFPELKSQLEPKYLESRERSSKLLGKIKALDAVLMEFSGSTNR